MHIATVAAAADLDLFPHGDAMTLKAMLVTHEKLKGIVTTSVFFHIEFYILQVQTLKRSLLTKKSKNMALQGQHQSQKWSFTKLSSRVRISHWAHRSKNSTRKTLRFFSFGDASAPRGLAMCRHLSKGSALTSASFNKIFHCDVGI